MILMVNVGKSASPMDPHGKTSPFMVDVGTSHIARGYLEPVPTQKKIKIARKMMDVSRDARILRRKLGDGFGHQFIQKQ